jgi:hypothetical protein
VRAVPDLEISRARTEVADSSKHPDGQFGSPATWARILSCYPRFFEILPKVYQAAEALVNRPTKSQFEFVLAEISRLSIVSFRELILIAANGYGLGALRLTRSLFEYSINARYLEKHPEERESFVHWHFVQQNKNLEYLKRTGRDKGLNPEIVVKSQAGFERIKHLFLDRRGRPRHTWSSASVRARAFDVGRGELYETIYSIGSDLLHGTMGGLAYLYRPRGSDVEPIEPPSLDYCELALLNSHKAVIETLEAHARALQVETKPLIEELDADFARVWGDSALAGVPLFDVKAVNGETVPRVGRDHPCPCGSGLKYKKCHGSTATRE